MQIHKVVNELTVPKYNSVVKQFNDKYNKFQEELYNKCLSLYNNLLSLQMSYDLLYNKFNNLKVLVKEL